MLRSMTGFGSVQTLIEGIQYTVEIRSLNGRYFKASIKLPDMWASAEAQVDRILREKLYRGSVNFSLRMQFASEAAAYTVNAAALARYVDQAKAALGDGAQFEAGSLLLLPGVCTPPSFEDVRERSWPVLEQAIESTCDHVLQMRVLEGQSLLKDLMDQCDSVEKHLQIVASRKDTVVAEYNKRLLSRVNELVSTAKLTVNEQDLIREVAVFAERCDINEEINRLRGHVEQFRQVAGESDRGGRKLDFISQEMLREANTIASKANDAEITRATVEIKGSIDRIKEQAQNAE